MKNIFLHLGFLFVLAGLSIICVDQVSANIKDYYSDLNQSNEIVEHVNNDYEDFKNISMNVKENIVKVSKSFNFYLEDFNTNNVGILEKINNVENDINSVVALINNLQNNCKYNLNNKIMDNQCKSFKKNFVNMVDSYNEMIEVYNSVIDTYNDYSEKNGRDKVDNYKAQLDSSIVAAAKVLG